MATVMSTQTQLYKFEQVIDPDLLEAVQSWQDSQFGDIYNKSVTYNILTGYVLRSFTNSSDPNTYYQNQDQYKLISIPYYDMIYNYSIYFGGYNVEGYTKLAESSSDHEKYHLGFTFMQKAYNDNWGDKALNSFDAIPTYNYPGTYNIEDSYNSPPPFIDMISIAKLDLFNNIDGNTGFTTFYPSTAYNLEYYVLYMYFATQKNIYPNRNITNECFNIENPLHYQYTNISLSDYRTWVNTYARVPYYISINGCEESKNNMFTVATHIMYRYIYNNVKYLDYGENLGYNLGGIILPHGYLFGKLTYGHICFKSALSSYTSSTVYIWILGCYYDSAIGGRKYEIRGFPLHYLGTDTSSSGHLTLDINDTTYKYIYFYNCDSFLYVFEWCAVYGIGTSLTMVSKNINNIEIKTYDI